MFENKKIAELEKEIQKLWIELKSLANFDGRFEIEAMKTRMNSLQGLINRKLGSEHASEKVKYDDGLDKLRV